MGLADCWCGIFYTVEALSDIQIKTEKLRQMESQTSNFAGKLDSHMNVPFV